MTASEFAFLAFGLVLGASAGAALLEVVRSRPPARHEIRLTVTPDSVPRRRAATLAEDHLLDGGLPDGRGGTTIGPAGPVPAFAAAAAGGPPDRTRVLPLLPPAGAGDPASSLPASRLAGSPEPVGIPIHLEPDPAFAALRSLGQRRRGGEPAAGPGNAAGGQGWTEAGPADAAHPATAGEHGRHRRRGRPAVVPARRGRASGALADRPVAAAWRSGDRNEADAGPGGIDPGIDPDGGGDDDVPRGAGGRWPVMPSGGASGGERIFTDDDAELRAAFGATGPGAPAILRLLRGDRAVLGRLVAQLGGDDPGERRRWQLALAGLVDAIVGRAIEASALDFPIDHPFWRNFMPEQSREIVAALSSLGYRFDGLGGWADDRLPSQRDLSLAVGYAGLDPMRIRRWPTEAEMRALLRDVTVAADAYLAEAAGDLRLGELSSLLGRRADGLADLWNEWGRVRPLLLAAG